MRLRVFFSLVAAVTTLAALTGCDTRLYPIRGAVKDQTIPCPSDMVGYATLSDPTSASGPTTGGGTAAATYTVSTLADFVTYAQLPQPLIIKVQGTITFPASPSSSQIKVASDKTILGIGSDAGLVGGGLSLKDSQNIIVRNLSIAKATETDAITVERSKNIWIDHCDLSSDLQGTYDGLVDITHASDFITVSWTRFHNHKDTGIVGHSADNGAEDTNHLTVTYHHDLFTTVTTGPRVRFGSVHIYNVQFEDITDYAVASQMGAQVLVENSLFENVTVPIRTMYLDPMDGFAWDVGNDYQNSGKNIILPADTSSTPWVPPYPYTADSDESALALINACAGTGKM